MTMWGTCLTGESGIREEVEKGMYLAGFDKIDIRLKGAEALLEECADLLSDIYGTRDQHDLAKKVYKFLNE